MSTLHLSLLSLAGLTATLLGVPTLTDGAGRGQPSASLAVADPASAPAAPPLLTGAPVHIARADDGLFYVNARVNGSPVRFVVDTGATATVLTNADAARIGIAPGPAATGRLATVGGSTAMRWAQLDRIDIAGHRIDAIDAVVPQADLPNSLLGQDVLTRLGGLTLEGDRLTVR